MEAETAAYNYFFSKREARGLNVKEVDGPDPLIERQLVLNIQIHSSIRKLRYDIVLMLRSLETELRILQDKKRSKKKMEIRLQICRIMQNIAKWHKLMMKYFRRHEPDFANHKNFLDGLNTSVKELQAMAGGKGASGDMIGDTAQNKSSLDLDISKKDEWLFERYKEQPPKNVG